MSTHNEVLQLLPGYPELPAAVRRVVDAHAETCAECADGLQRYWELRSDVTHAPRLAPDPLALAALHSAIRRRASGGAADRRNRSLPAGAWLAACALVLVVSAGLWLAARASSRPVRPTLPPVASATPAATRGPAATAVSAADSAGSAVPAPAEAVAWLKYAAVPFAGAEPGSGSADDLAGWRGMIGNARIVVIDDSTYYGTHELQALQQRLLEDLVQQMGFNHLLVDAPWPEADLINGYIRDGQGAPEQLLAGLTGTRWQTAEMLYTARWLNAYNQKPDAAPGVQLQGFLPVQVGVSSVARDVLNAYLQQVDPTATVDVALGAGELSHRLETRRAEYVAKSSAGAYLHALQAAHILAQTEQLGAVSDANERRQLLIQFVAENLLAAIDGAEPGDKFVLWTHGRAGSAAQDPEGVMELLRLHYADQVVALGMTFHAGDLYAATTSDRLPATPLDLADRAVHQIPPAMPGSYEDFFAQAGLPRFVIDLRRLPTAAPAADWLSQPHPHRQLGASYDDCYPEDYFETAQLQARLDAIIFFDQVSPAAPLVHLPAAAPVACQRAPENLDFGAGTQPWFMIDEGLHQYQMGTEPAASGQARGYLRWAPPDHPGALQPPPTSSAGMGQVFRADNYRGRRVRLAANLQIDAPATLSYFGLQVFGPRYQPLGSAQVQVESTVARRYDLVLDVPVDATRIRFGVSLDTQGQISLSDVRFEVVGQDVPLSQPGTDNG